MTKNATLEMNENNKTGTVCSDSSLYCCKMHPYIEKYVESGDNFPQCDQKNIPHNTVWYKIIKKY